MRARAILNPRSPQSVKVTFRLNGEARSIEVFPGRSLLEVLREDLGLTGTKYGCGEGQCGACTVLVDGVAVRSCLMEAAGAAGKTVVTIEGLARSGALHPVQEAFIAEGAVQCGFCTPGMVLAAAALLAKNPHPTEAQIVEGMNGNLCRCSGYVKISSAIRRAAAGGGK